MGLDSSLVSQYLRSYVAAMTACEVSSDDAERRRMFADIASEMPYPFGEIITDDEGGKHVAMDLSELFLAAVILMNYLVQLISDVTDRPVQALIGDVGMWVAENWPPEGIRGTDG